MKMIDDHYLTESPILAALVRLALPIMASSLFSTAYNLTDMLWIGKLGSVAVAAVGAGGMFLWFSNGIAVLAKMGGQIYTSQCIGRRDMRLAGCYAWGALVTALIIGMTAGTICAFFPEGLIRLLQIKEAETIRLGGRYLRITGGMLAIPFVNHVLTGLYTAKGDSRLPLIANMTGLIINMILDPILVPGMFGFPRLGVVGAAVATVFAQCISLSIFVIHMLRSAPARAGSTFELWPPVKAPGSIYADILKMGVPAAMQSCAYCVFSMILTSICAGYGSEAVAVMRLGGQIESISWNAADGFGTALNAFTGQNYGARNFDRIKKGFRISTVIVVTWGLLITLLLVGLPGTISRLFFFEPQAIAISVSYLTVVGLSEPFMCAEINAGAALCGLGKTAVFSAVSILLTGFRIPLAFLLTKNGMGLYGVWWALTLTSMAKGVMLTIVFISVVKNLRFLNKE